MRLEYDISEYNSMHLRQKAVIIESAAIFLDHDLSLGITHTLFAYHNYFIEVLLEYESNSLLEIVAFQEGPRLDRYLEHIKLKDLV